MTVKETELSTRPYSHVVQEPDDHAVSTRHSSQTTPAATTTATTMTTANAATAAAAASSAFGREQFIPQTASCGQKTRWILSLCIAAGSAALVLIGAVRFVHHCAKMIARKEQHHVVVSDYLTVMITMLVALFGSLFGFYMLFYAFLRSPLKTRYANEAVEIQGRILQRHVSETRTRFNRPVRTHRVLVAYSPVPNQYFVKKYVVNMQEFQASELALMVLPGLPTSAVLKRTIVTDEYLLGFKKTKFCFMLIWVLLFPIFWVFVFQYAITSLAPTDPWRRSTEERLFVLLLANILFGISASYAAISIDCHKMLHRGKPIPRRMIPADFLVDEEAQEEEHDLSLQMV